jgi:hypothetical protein
MWLLQSFGSVRTQLPDRGLRADQDSSKPRDGPWVSRQIEQKQSTARQESIAEAF